MAERLVDVYFDLTAQRAKVLDHFRRLTSLRHARGPVVDLSSHSAVITEIGQQIEARLKAHDIMPPEPEPELTSKESVHE